ncbi:peptidase M48-like protein [Neolewinella xylanilytica]|uniref:Peptidase M48-like protein n=1 Tax=Neolewinella xylanilytica TaxID=1514080 RepID=A0A2S6IA75_9BACT|nr:M48 family metallopeptidase [Neolewinella xylanilytica]PPK88403.1 peptidase M48-like protein [Neolewinella xylanilytica]
MNIRTSPLLPLLALLFFASCSEDGDLNVFSVEQDLELGRQTNQEIRSNPSEFPILDPADYPQAYTYLQGMVNDIVQQGEVDYADVFPYEVAIIDQDVENAFATPGGFLYVYTGLIGALDNESELAGVLAHEIAHSAERHSTDQLTTQYGFSTLISVVTGGDPGLLSEIAGSLLSLRFSRSDEEEADARSVDYLCNTEYAANGAAGFFESIQDGGSPPAFLSSHPNPEDRVADINARAQEQNCSIATGDQSEFQAFKASLPL